MNIQRRTLAALCFATNSRIASSNISCLVWRRSIPSLANSTVTGSSGSGIQDHERWNSNRLRELCSAPNGIKVDAARRARNENQIGVVCLWPCRRRRVDYDAIKSLRVGGIDRFGQPTFGQEFNRGRIELLAFSPIQENSIINGRDYREPVRTMRQRCNRLADPDWVPIRSETDKGEF